ncbi:hypothetical protein PAMP_016674 [Pampus punctatissimus]
MRQRQSDRVEIDLSCSGPDELRGRRQSKASHAPCVRPRTDLRHAGSSVGARERERQRERGSVATARNIPLYPLRASSCAGSAQHTGREERTRRISGPGRTRADQRGPNTHQSGLSRGLAPLCVYSGRGEPTTYTSCRGGERHVVLPATRAC